MPRLAQAALAGVLSLAAVAALALPIWYWDGGLIKIESTHFVRQYLDNRSTLQKIFDPHGNHLDTYQARELSYFVDYLDARTFQAFMLADRPLFVPASALAASALSLLLSIAAIVHFPASARLPAALVLLAYVTNYVHVITTAMLYRSSKPLLAPVLMGTVFYLLAVLRDRKVRDASLVRRMSPPLVVFLLFSTMSLLDRQGFFYAAAGCLVLLIHAALFGGRRDVLAGGVAAVSAMMIYNLIFAPMLVERINGYAPNFEYQRVPWQHLFTDPRIVGHAGELVLQAVALLMGGAPLALFALVFTVALAWMLFSGRKAIALVVIGVGVLQMGLVALMIARHPPIFDDYDHRLWYYPLPFQALLVALLIAIVGRVVPAWGTVRTGVLSLVLAALVVGNVLRWDDHRRAQLRSGWWFRDVYSQTATLKASFADGRPRPWLSPEFAAFFEFWRTRAPALRERAERAKNERP